MYSKQRRQLLAGAVCGLTQFATGIPLQAILHAETPGSSFKVSLSERSLAKAIRAGKIEHLDFARISREEFNISAVDYVTSLFRDQIGKDAFLTEMNKRAADHGVRQILLVADREGELAHPDPAERQRALQRHQLIMDAAQALGCRSICVQLRGTGMPDEVAKRSEESLRQLVEYSGKRKVSVLVTNCGGQTQDPQWLSGLVRSVDSKNCGVFPYFNGFGSGDRYKGMSLLMNAAQGVCATAKSFDENGNESDTDYSRMLTLIAKAGYRGYVSAEYLGEPELELEGIRSTRKLISQFFFDENP